MPGKKTAPLITASPISKNSNARIDFTGSSIVNKEKALKNAIMTAMSNIRHPAGFNTLDSEKAETG